jgi:putative DNA primase/helicase
MTMEENARGAEDRAQDTRDPLEEARRVLDFMVEEAAADPATFFSTALNTSRDPERRRLLEALAYLDREDPGSMESGWLAFDKIITEYNENIKEDASTETKKLNRKGLEGLIRTVRKEGRKAKNRFRVVTPEDARTLPTVKSVLLDAPVSGALRIPRNYRLTPTALWVTKTTNTKDGEVTKEEWLAPSPILLAGRLIYADGTAYLRVLWRRDGRWCSADVARKTAMTAREITDLTNLEFPVTSTTARDMVNFLAAFEAANLDTLPKARVTSQLGWQGPDGSLGFLYGLTHILPDGTMRDGDIEALDPTEWRAESVFFRARDVGDRQLALAYRSAGSYEEWHAAMQRAASYPRVILSFYQALAPPLQMITGTTTFGGHWSGESTHGKTSTLRVGASAVGCPDEAAPTLVTSWNTTRVAYERRAETCTDLPLFFDETREAKTPGFVGQAVFDLCSGHTRPRGSLTGTQRMGSWRTSFLSSGESPLSASIEAGGGHARVLEVRGKPWGEKNETSATMIVEIMTALFQNFGHAGKLFVQFLVRNRAQWPIWRESYANHHRAFLTKAAISAPDNLTAGRFAAYFALLTLTAELAHQALNLGWPYQPPITDELWTALVGEGAQTNRAAAALAAVYSWAHSHEQEFYGRRPKDRDGEIRQPVPGWAGVWNRNELWRWIAFHPGRLEEFLKSKGFAPDEIFRIWREREWLLTDSDKQRNQRKVRIPSGAIRMIVIKREAFASPEKGPMAEGDTILRDDPPEFEEDARDDSDFTSNNFTPTLED